MSTLKKVYWKKGIALKKQQSAEKFSLSPWNSGLLAAISARANNETFYTKVFISPGENLNFQSWEASGVLTHQGVPQYELENPAYFYWKWHVFPAF